MLFYYFHYNFSLLYSNTSGEAGTLGLRNSSPSTSRLGMKGGGVTWELVHWSDTGTLTDDFLGFMIPAPSSPHCVPFCQLPKHLVQIMGLYLRAFHVKFWLQKNMLECFVTRTPLEQFPLFDPSHTQWPFQWTCQPLIDSSDDSRSRCRDLRCQ